MKTKLGLIGHKISYSISPLIHEAIGRFVGADIDYELIDITSDLIPTYIELLKQGKYQGFNVTKPYKEEMIAYVDELSPIAQSLKAINTIYMQDGKVIGDNTDVFGYKYLLDYFKINVKDKKVLILGTGGASKAVAYVLKQRDANVTFASRTPGLKKDTISYHDIKPKAFDIYINATPIGTYPNIDHCVLSKDEVVDQIVIDLIYKPKETQLMKFSKEAYNGFVMLLAQAVKSEMLWLEQHVAIHETIDELMDVIKYE